MEEQRSSDTVGQCDRQHSQHIPSLTAVKILINFTAKESFKEAAKQNLLQKTEVRQAKDIKSMKCLAFFAMKPFTSKGIKITKIVCFSDAWIPRAIPQHDTLSSHALMVCLYCLNAIEETLIFTSNSLAS